MVSDMSANDNIVCFQLPCHAQQSRTWKPSDDPEDDPVIMAVHLTRESTSSRTSYKAPNGFAHPLVIALSPEQARDKKLVYEAVVDRLQRWTSNARDLFQWEHEVPEELVPIQLSNARDERLRR